MLTLQWLLDREDLALRRIAGADPSTVRIDWVHSIELDDPTPWLQGGELVLTTGLRLPRARAEQAAYVRRLAGADVAALAFGTGVRFDTVPRALQDACAELGLALVEVPLPTPFVAVTQAIAARIAELQYESMERTVRFQRRLTAAALSDGPGGVVRGLADELRAGVVLLDERRQVVESARQRPDLAGRVRTELDRGQGGERASMHVIESDRSIEWHSLGGRTGISGWLAIDTATSLSSTERVLLNQALSLLALLRDRPRDVRDRHRRVGSTVLDLLLDPHAAARGAEHLRGFGLDAGGPVTVLVARPDPGTAVPENATTGLDALGLPYLTTLRGDDLVVLAHAADATAFATALAGTGSRGTVGVSSPVPPRSCADGLVQAVRAAESAGRRRERLGRYDALPLGHVLDDETVRERIDDVAGRALRELAGHPALTESLEVFLHTNGSWETASRTLGVHRHTLRNRMARVEELTGLSLDVAENRVLLLLALLTR